MHRHVTTSRKLSRDRDQREALIRGLATSLVLHERIETTEAKAKEVAPYTERLITRAKKGGVYNHRLVIRGLLTENAVQKLMYELTPAFKERNGGYTRIVKLGNRRGDNAPLASISLVLPEKVAPAEAKIEAADKPATAAKPAKAEAKPARKASK
jgi:large subunit ribosomal protein L17